MRAARAFAAALALVAAAPPVQTARPTLDYASAATIRDTCLDWRRRMD